MNGEDRTNKVTFSGEVLFSSKDSGDTADPHYINIKQGDLEIQACFRKGVGVPENMTSHHVRIKGRIRVDNSGDFVIGISHIEPCGFNGRRDLIKKPKWWTLPYPVDMGE